MLQAYGQSELSLQWKLPKDNRFHFTTWLKFIKKALAGMSCHKSNIPGQIFHLHDGKFVLLFLSKFFGELKAYTEIPDHLLYSEAKSGIGGSV